MADPRPFETNLRDARVLKGWSQDELARTSGISRAGVSSIETGRLIPSTAAALALASALGCRVEDLFRLRSADIPVDEPAWAWRPPSEPCRYWRAEVGGSVRIYPVEATAAGLAPHDGFFDAGRFLDRREDDSRRTLVLAGCDPAVGILGDEMARSARIRLLAFSRSSASALSLLGRGLVHAAGVHLAGGDDPDGNACVVRKILGRGYKLVRVAGWEEGIAVASSSRIRSVQEALGSNLRWIGREEGSGARQCLDELLEGRKPPRRLATDHRGVAEAIRNGWADAGVCLRLVGEEAGLIFLPLRREAYDLCFPERFERDPRIQSLIQILRSSAPRRLLGDLPGYDSRETGAVRTVG